MASLNLSETQNTSLNSKNTACNTSPIACACCGSKYYIQILPQPYCFRVQQPEIQRCKHPRECFEENFTNLQPQGFPPFLPFPMIPPFFHNSPLPVNSSYAYNHLDKTNAERKDYQTDGENAPHLSRKDAYCQREKNELSGNKATINENASVSGPELQYSGQPFNIMDPHLNSVVQPCGWGDSFPWSCSPFIAPMISYCLFWNSHKFGVNNPFKNYAPHSSGNGSQKSDDRAKSESKEFPKDFEGEGDNKTGSSTEIKIYSQEEGMEVENDEINQSSRNSTVNSELENSFKNIEKEEELVGYQKTSEDSCEGEGEEDAEMEGFDSAVQVESDECFQINEKRLSNYKTASCLSMERNDNSPESTVEEEISYLMTRNENAVDGPTSETQFNSSDASVADENGFLSFQDQTQISKAAAGDLGGVNCDGYKITIDSFEKDDEEKTCQETEPEDESEPKELELQDTELTQKSNSAISGKNQSENSRSIRSFQSGIAKLSKAKDSKTDGKKSLKYDKEFSQKERDFTKRKHSCIFSHNNDSGSKIQKTRNCTGVQQQSTGQAKAQKETMRIPSLTRKKKNFSD